FYDGDGNGAGAVQLIATLQAGAALSATDIAVVPNDGGLVHTGSQGNDSMPGASGDETFIGYGGDDTMSGGAGNDALFAGEGDDKLDGGTGNDTLEGGSGFDQFIFTSAGTTNADRIDDFASGVDKLHLDAGLMSA